MQPRRVTRWIPMILVVAFVLFAGPTATAFDRISHGDVKAVLNAFTTGGRVILLHASETAGYHAAPTDFLGSNGAIRPLPPWDQVHVCVDDWHVILIGYFTGGDASFTMQDAREEIGNPPLSFTLDGQPLATDRTPIKRFLEPEDFGLEEAYGFQQGVLIAPGELALGEHELIFRDLTPGVDYESTITFFV